MHNGGSDYPILLGLELGLRLEIYGGGYKYVLEPYLIDHSITTTTF